MKPRNSTNPEDRMSLRQCPSGIVQRPPHHAQLLSQLLCRTESQRQCPGVEMKVRDLFPAVIPPHFFLLNTPPSPPPPPPPCPHSCPPQSQQREERKITPLSSLSDPCRPRGNRREQKTVLPSVLGIVGSFLPPLSATQKACSPG